MEVVDALELVKIDQQQRGVPLAAFEQLAGDDGQVAAVVQAGHFVVVREVADPQLGGALLRERRLELHRPAPGEQQQRDVEHERRGELGRRRGVVADGRHQIGRDLRTRDDEHRHGEQRHGGRDPARIAGLGSCGIVKLAGASIVEVPNSIVRALSCID
jgi:hypothetical protein